MGVTFYEEETLMKPEISTLKKKGQVTIPAGVRKLLDLSEDDQLEVSVEEGRIILNPVVTISKDQAWFWTKEWQKEEREAEDDIANGQVDTFDDVTDAIKFLRKG